MTYVELQNLEKHYGDITALDGISFDMNEGEFVSILGPSGSGKTTCLRLLAGFEQPSAGTIHVDGDEVTPLPPEDRSMSMVFQDLALFPHLTVRDNIAFGLKMQTDLSKTEIDERVSESLELVELPGYEDRKIQGLSGGEQQRIALARAIVVEPKVILFDEPLSDLDRQLRENMRREIGDLHDNLGITSLYVTHNQREALTLADRIAVMEGGEIVRVGTPQEIYSNPQTEFVANFVGDSNFISGSVVKKNGSKVFESPIVSLAIGSGASVHGSDVTLFVRPENLQLGTNGSEPTVSCTVTSSTHLGSVTEYTIDIGGQEFLVTELGSPAFDSGDETEVTFREYDFLQGES
jgi:ABC-type Fe3+/spermidine/putrescine transport system ATPase subunit